MTKKTWTTKPPIDPGLYWAYEALDADIMLVRLEDDGKFWMVMYDMVFEANHFSHFMPFEYPEAPPNK